ncbi:hypothetical protein MG293_007321 [Ovis ammon polii]|uniref:Uncharacterized protein n=1 Tax=Ovis ammon polii TaxID=230172 RepID=A0AAD4UC77_OVIAM|nr:hypothetical protein MG293_007321 [Ovis ammon polii]KAI4573279.1 hypothetical protein MJT46_004519 [Ovis ammon polii x Ovis aries]
MLKLFCSLYSMGHRKGHKGEEKVQILTVGLGPARFQLQYMGHYVVHDERRDPDPRVQDFVPDNWQGEPLDIVDKNKSAVIMAPKSSGKTYTSYCCMERVLHEGNERMVVYVAPTKENVALTDLGITSVCGKRSKCSCLWVLITVPACFEILLLAPYHQVWVTRIRYVIFDEQETNDIPKTEQCQKSIFQRSCVQRNKVNSFYFANKVVIRKMDARKCEESLKAELTSWVKNGHINKDFQLSVKSSGSEIDQRERTLVLDFSPAPPSMCALSSDGCRQREPFHGPDFNEDLTQTVGDEKRLETVWSVTAGQQMSAHAGRHGEDLTGSVFFGNIPLPKTERPLGSNVPELNDQFPLSLSLVLRRMLLGAKADDKEDASAKVVLKALPEDLATGAEEHNDRVQNVASFLLTISKLAAMRKECQLPLSETGKAENVRAV